MARDQIEEQVSGVATSDMTAEEMQTFLGSRINGFLGLMIDVDTQGAVRLKGGVVSNVHINSAWVGLTHDGTPYRTKKIQDRDNLISWTSNGGTEPFSAHPDFKDDVGPPNVCFMRMPGGN